MSAWPLAVVWPGGSLGQQNEEVYGELLDLSAEEIADLGQAGVF